MHIPSPFGLAWKTLFFYIVLIIVMRVTGKREIASLSPLDLVVSIMIADAAVIAIEQDNYPIWVGLIPVGVLAFAEISLSYLMLKNMRIRAWVAGKPSIIVKHGQINEAEMRSLRYNLDELLSQMRETGIHNIADVEFALLEPTGKLTVIPKAEKRPLTPLDLGIIPPKDSLPVNLIVDGQVDDEVLRGIGKNREWLDTQLAKKGLKAENVLLASLDAKGDLFVQGKIKDRRK